MWKIMHRYQKSCLQTPQFCTTSPTIFFLISNPGGVEIFHLPESMLPTWYCWNLLHKFSYYINAPRFSTSCSKTLMGLDQKSISLCTFQYVGEKKKRKPQTHKITMKINCVFHLQERHVLSSFSPLSGAFSININAFLCPAVSSQCNLPCNLFTGVESLYQPQIVFFLADKKPPPSESKAFTLSKTPIALKGMDSKALTARPPQPSPPPCSRMHCAVKMMNDLQQGDRELSLTARRWELYLAYISLQRSNKTRWLSPASQVTSYISELPKAIAVSSHFTVHPSSLPPNCKSLLRRVCNLLFHPSRPPVCYGLAVL